MPSSRAGSRHPPGAGHPWRRHRLAVHPRPTGRRFRTSGVARRHLSPRHRVEDLAGLTRYLNQPQDQAIRGKNCLTPGQGACHAAVGRSCVHRGSRRLWRTLMGSRPPRGADDAAAPRTAVACGSSVVERVRLPAPTTARSGGFGADINSHQLQQPDQRDTDHSKVIHIACRPNTPQ